MPRLEVAPIDICADHIVTSIGGSTLFPPENPWLNTEFFQQWKKFIEEQLQANRSIVAIIGGGEIARKRQQAAREVGITSQHIVDTIGIDVTRHNARLLRQLFIGVGITARQYQWQKLKPSVIYLRGGTEPGHTTDLVAVQAAISTGVNIVFNISNTPGLYPYLPDGTFDNTRIMSNITYDELLPYLQEHTPGSHGPDKHAMILARHHNITFVCIGPDFGNLAKCMCGEEFVGTVVSQSLGTAKFAPKSKG